jgi:aryl-alcohol dehydrogenase-like predicted oxidoreductase
MARIGRRRRASEVRARTSASVRAGVRARVSRPRRRREAVHVRPCEQLLEKNLAIVDEVEAVASEIDATPAQVALARLLAQGDDIAPIPGTKRVSRVEENTAADHIELSLEQITRLNQLAPATGDRHDEANMSTVGR